MTKTYTPTPPIWCAGCGHFGVQGALERALIDLNIAKHDTMILAGIGCSGSLQNNVGTYGFHALHGRVLPTATGVAFANPELTVIAVGGDGDGFAIGAGHFVHTVKRNPNFLYIVMNNSVYGLTKGQDSPTMDSSAAVGMDATRLALSIRWIDRGPAIFTQTRVGLGGRRFTLHKLRTMKVASELELEDHLNGDPDARREWNSRFKLRRDPRLVPGVGRWLRRLSIDELPQLWNVVIGEMSLVGPRPLPGYHLETFSESFRYLRGQVRPGLTGLWQVMAREDASEEKKILYDSYYIRNWSLWMDLYILALTVLAVFRARGDR